MQYQQFKVCQYGYEYLSRCDRVGTTRVTSISPSFISSVFCLITPLARSLGISLLLSPPEKELLPLPPPSEKGKERGRRDLPVDQSFLGGRRRENGASFTFGHGRLEMYGTVVCFYRHKHTSCTFMHLATQK